MMNFVLSPNINWLYCSFSMSGVLYMGVAVCGFLMFGDSTKSQFTLNMPTKFAASEVAAWTVVWEKNPNVMLCFFFRI